MEKLKNKLKVRFGRNVYLDDDTQQISISGLPALYPADIEFIQKSIKGHFVNYSVHPASSSVYVKILKDV
jgi:hypothetical protein